MISHKIVEFSSSGQVISTISGPILNFQGKSLFMSAFGTFFPRKMPPFAYFSGKQKAPAEQVVREQKTDSLTHRGYIAYNIFESFYTVTITPPSLAYMLLTPRVSMIRHPLNSAFSSRSFFMVSARSGALQ